MRSRVRAVIASVPGVVGSIALAQSEMSVDSVVVAGGAATGAAAAFATLLALVRARSDTSR